MVLIEVKLNLFNAHHCKQIFLHDEIIPFPPNFGTSQVCIRPLDVAGRTYLLATINSIFFSSASPASAPGLWNCTCGPRSPNNCKNRLFTVLNYTTVGFFEAENSNIVHRQGKRYFWTKQLVSFFPWNWAILGNVG